MLHHHRIHRARQLRWVLSTVGVLFVAVLATLALVYVISNQMVQQQFFSAHIQIHRTGEMIERGLIISVALLTVLLVLIGVWALRVAHRVVRPVHLVHRALDELMTGNLGVRLELHRQDEFQEIATALNQLVEEFSGTLTRIHDLVDRIETLAEQVAREAKDQSAESQLYALSTELNKAMEYFRPEPRHVIRERA